MITYFHKSTEQLSTLRSFLYVYTYSQIETLKLTTPVEILAQKRSMYFLRKSNSSFLQELKEEFQPEDK